MKPDSYLRSVLADSQRRFRYRSGVAWLLGQPDVIGPHPTPLRLPRGGFHYLRINDVRSHDVRPQDARPDVRPHDARPDGGWPGPTEIASSSHVGEPEPEATDLRQSPFWVSPDAHREPTESMGGEAGEEMPGDVGTDWLTTGVNAPPERAALPWRSMTVGPRALGDATARRPVAHRVRQQSRGGPPDPGATTQEEGGPDPLRALGACHPPHCDTSAPQPSAPLGPSARAAVPSQGNRRPSVGLIVAAEDGATEPNASAAAASTHTGPHREDRTPFHVAARPMPPVRSNTPATPARRGQAGPVASGDGLLYVSDPVRNTKLTTAIATVEDAVPQWPTQATRPTRAAATSRSDTGTAVVDSPPAQPTRPNPPPPQPEILSIQPAGEDPYGGVPGFWARRHLRARQLRVLR